MSQTDRARFRYASIMRQVGDAGPEEADTVVGFHGRESKSTIKRFIVDDDVTAAKYERLELIEFDQRMSNEDIREWFEENDPLEKWCDDDGFYQPDSERDGDGEDGDDDQTEREDNILPDGGVAPGEPDRIASVDEAPLCHGCGLISHYVHENTPLCPDCWTRRNWWQHQGLFRYVTKDGDCRHETPLCPAIRGRAYKMVKEEMVYLDTEQCDRCDGFVLFGEFDRRVTDGGQPREARISKCQCGFCEQIFSSGTVVEIAKKLARHWNQEHGRELRHSMEPFETVEYGGHHLHGDEYAVKRLDRYITAYDVIDPGDGSPFEYQYAKAIESEDTCEDCWTPIDELDDEDYRELDDGGWRDKFLCRSCHDERVTERRREENVQLEAFEEPGGELA